MNSQSSSVSRLGLVSCRWLRYPTVLGALSILLLCCRASGQAYDGPHPAPHELLMLKGHTGNQGERSVHAVAYSPDGKWLVTGGQDGTTRLWDASTGQEKAVLKGHTADVNSVAYSPDGRLIATASGDKTVKLWDASTGQQKTNLKLSIGTVFVAFSPDSKSIVTGNSLKPGEVILWDVATGKQQQVFKGHTWYAYCAAFLPGGKYLLTGSADQTARLWEVSTGRLLRTFKTGGAVISIAVSPDGKRVATGGNDNTGGRDDFDVTLWDLSTGHAVTKLKGLEEEVHGIAFSPDGKRLTAGSFDFTARVWNIATGHELVKLWGHAGEVLDIAYSPDGKRVATTSADGTILIWDVSDL